MRLEVNITIGGASLTDGDCGAGELARIMQDVEFLVLTGGLAREGDEARLLDLNGHTVGHARMASDWAVGQQVWVTTTEGALLKSTITLVSPTLDDYVEVRCRFLASNQHLSPVIVDQFGHDQLGRPVLARVP